ncbi:dihydromonapterin reductase [Thalassotalea ponticola]|uniref:dihydromonapterin reductase n=1 Tax=Thalassotalea ponticola TaxID=1523392 RepID=UPI0025B56E65|nr:dihydromonapterin reductase [Thalassotalea ponticola]MDN3651922.1 dihydromonapterin reductase [Thalassotalea ponticola]
MQAHHNKHTIIITGAGQRLGLHTAKALIAKGYHLVISYRTHKPGVDELSELGADCIQADFATDRGIGDFIETIKSRYASIRAIIHNASDWHPENDKLDASALMTAMMQVHVHAPYQLNLALAPALQRFSEQQNMCSDIIHLTDYVVETGSSKHIAYAASKAALANLALSFAKKLAPHVKVNCIAPSLLSFNEWDDEQYRKKTAQKSLLGIVPGEAEGVEAIVWLLHSKYVNGRTIHLDGGRHLR